MPLFIVTVFAEIEQTPLTSTVTGLFDPPPVAATVKLSLYVSVGGAWLVTLIVWASFVAVTDSVTSDAPW